MNAHSSEHPISAEERPTARISRALAQALPSKPDIRAAMAGVLRERRRRAAPVSGAGSELEAEVASMLYGDAASRHRAFDTQPSRIWPARPSTDDQLGPDRKAA